MTGTNHDNKPDQDTSEHEQRANRGLQDWEMVEQMSHSDGDMRVWGRTVVITIVLGFAAFVALAYGVYYFLIHYGFHFFTAHTG